MSDESRSFEENVREELDRVLSSPEFRNAERLTRLLRHVVERTLEGATDRLKESVLGLEVFDRSGFDPRVDPIVRVEASRLRKRLDDFYRRSGCPLGVAIGLPKGSYASSFEKRVLGCAPESTPDSGPRRSLAVAPIGAACVAVSDDLIHRVLARRDFRVIPWTFSAGTEAEALRHAANSDIDVLICVFERQFEHDVRIFLRATDVRRTTYVACECTAADRSVWASNDATLTRFIDCVRDGGPPGQPAKHVASSAAYNLYLKGRYYWNLRTEAGLWKAVDYFRQAMAEDAECALACAGLADSYTLLANYGAVAPDEVRPKAKEYALRGMAIDATLAEAHTSLAHVHATYEWDWQTAELEYLTAIRLNPSYATARHWYGITLLAPLRRLDDALDEIRRARECDAISLSILRDEGLVRLYKGDAEAAHETAAQLLALDNGFAGGWWLMGLIAEAQSRFDAAAQTFQRAVEISGRHPRMIGALGHSYALAGRFADAEGILAEFEEMSAGRYVSPFDIALVEVGLGRLEAAFSHLSKALSLRSYELVTLQVDPRYAPLRPLAGYEQLVRTLGFSRRDQSTRRATI